MRLPARRFAAALVFGVLLLASSVFFLKGTASESTPTAVVRRGRLAVTLTESGVLRAEASTVYRSPVEGRELEIEYLAPEGAEVRVGDPLVRLDATALKTELDRAGQALRQAEMELQAADVGRREAEFAVDAAMDGIGAIAVDEARTAVRLADTKAARLREEHAGLKPLLDKGYITRDELDRAALDAEEAQAAADLARRKLQVLVERTRPAEQQTARLQLARRITEVEHLRPKVDEARAYRQSVAAAIEGCTIVAKTPGLVIYEDNLFVAPRRKIRIGDRVTPSQGLITLPDLRRMEVDSSVRESDIHFVAAGRPARVGIDAFPGVQLTGVVARIGTIARALAEHASDEKRFDITIRLNPASVDLRPGMTARVDIAGVERTDALLVPAAAVFARDGVPTCYIARRRGVEPRMVQIGSSNETDVEIVAGLRPGERVALTPPAAGR